MSAGGGAGSGQGERGDRPRTAVGDGSQRSATAGRRQRSLLTTSGVIVAVLMHGHATPGTAAVHLNYLVPPMADMKELLRPIRDRYRRLPLLAHPIVTGRHIRAGLVLRSHQGLKLHLGCGMRRQDGYINIDLNASPATDYVGSITRLPCKPQSVERIEAYHVIEHLPHPEVPAALANWRQALADGGVLVLECPNFDEAVREYLDGNSDRIYNIFGLQRFRGDAHLFGYNPERLSALLRDAGFSSVVEGEPTDYHTLEEPCMRLEATR